jgi:hypothetical protein
MKMRKVKFLKIADAPTRIEAPIVETAWTGYTGGDIPAGLIVARLGKLGAVDEPANAWTVFHKSGYPVDLQPAFTTRKAAILLAAGLGNIAHAHKFTWDQDREDLIKTLVADGTYSAARREIKDAIRDAVKGVTDGSIRNTKLLDGK